jgi:hypothetical protein
MLLLITRRKLGSALLLDALQRQLTLTFLEYFSEIDLDPIQGYLSACPFVNAGEEELTLSLRLMDRHRPRQNQRKLSSATLPRQKR